MKITAYITKAIYTINFKAKSQYLEPRNGDYYSIEASKDNKNNEFKKYQINGNKIEASKDTFTKQTSTAKNTSPQKDNSNLLYSRLFLY